MNEFDYQAAAELFPARGRQLTRQIVSYKRFESAALAIRYAMEELDPELLQHAILQVEDERYDVGAIESLYASAAYPLERSPSAKRSSKRNLNNYFPSQNKFGF